MRRAFNSAKDADMTDPIATLERTGRIVMRSSLVFFFLAFGLYKFTAVEAAAIQPLMANSPLFAWLYDVFSVQGASNFIGVVEVTAAVLIALRPWSPRASAIGSLVTVVALLGTEGDLQGFLLKDLGLLGIALWSAGEAFRAARERLSGAATVAVAA
jgi:reactive chlorine resistance protein C